MFKDRQFLLARYWSNRELRKLAEVFSGSIVNVSAGEDVDKQGKRYRDYFCNASEYHTTNFSPGSIRGFRGRPDEHLLDLTSEAPAELRGRYDVALSHTVLEHVFDVGIAFRNTCELSRDVVIVVVPFAQVQHENESYQDYWRFTPSCLRAMFAQNKMEVVYESWNNDQDASVYLISVGSRHPEKWRNTLPPSCNRPLPADWIGTSRITSALRRRCVNSFQPKTRKQIKSMIRRVLPARLAG